MKAKSAKPGMARQRFARDHQITRLQRIVGAAETGQHALPQPSGLTQRMDPPAAGRVNVAVGRIPMLDFGHFRAGPFVQLIGKGAVLRVKKRNAQMPGPAHDVLSPGQNM